MEENTDIKRYKQTDDISCCSTLVTGLSQNFCDRKISGTREPQGRTEGRREGQRRGSENYNGAKAACNTAETDHRC